MDAIFYFDTEDSISPPQAGCDDIVLWLADLLTQQGIRGSFHVMGDKARILQARRRQDVIAAVARHDVSSHFDHGSSHPMTVERVSGLDWAQGVSVAMEAEKPGFEVIEQTFGRCAGLTRHGSSYAPQIIRAAGLCGKAYHGLPFSLPHHRVFWFCGTLCTNQYGFIHNHQGKPGSGKFEEDIFADPPRFEAQLMRFLPELEAAARQWDFTALFGCHPLRLCVSRFCDNYVGGRNVSPPVPPPVRTEEEKRLIRRQFTRYVTALAQVKGVRFIGLDGVLERYGRQPRTIAADHLLPYARQVCDTHGVPLDTWHSPAELLVGLAQAIVEYHASRRLPAHVRVVDVIGPADLLDESVERSAPSRLDWDTLVMLARELILAAHETGMLPTSLSVGDGVLPPAGLLSALAGAYERLARGDEPSSIEATWRSQAPDEAQAWADETRLLQKWRILDPATSFERIAHFTRCQSWSVKPAHGL